VETAGNFVGVTVEFSAGMENGETTSAAGRFSVACMSTGMPRPLSTTVTDYLRER